MIKLRFHGHSCWEVESGEHRVLIDPFLTGNELAEVKPESFDRLDAILITHGHFDHIADAHVHAQLAVLLVATRPGNRPRFRYATARTTAHGEVHCRLTMPHTGRD